LISLDEQKQKASAVEKMLKEAGDLTSRH